MIMTILYVLDQIEELDISEPNIFPFLLKLPEIQPQIQIVFISFLKWNLLQKHFYCEQPLTVNFPKYTRQETIDILMLDGKENIKYEQFVGLVIDSISSVTNNLNELRYLCFILYPKYIEPIKEGKGFTPQYKTVDQVNEMQRKVEGEKSKTKEYRLEIEQKKEDIISISKQLQHLINEIQVNKQQLFNDLSIAKEKEQELLDLQIEFQNNDELKESEKQESELLKQLEKELKAKQESNEKLKKRKQELSANNEELRKTRQEAKERELEAKRISEKKDPQVEELGKWFKEQLKLLYRFNQTKINTLSDTKFQVIIEDVTITYILNDKKLDIQADNVEFQDILEMVADFPLNEAIGTSVSVLNNRVMNYLNRKREMEIIVQNGGIFDDELLELLVQAESGRAFVLKIDPNYPLSGLENIKIVGIEPQEDDDEKLVWTEKIKSMDLKTISDLLPLLE
ncbi:Origin recognition complex subunit 5 [Terramyces sp. JEL0728]|nr:Origin recognition complex subunit 5 [Terramyces sp. JEL0728]